MFLALVVSTPSRIDWTCRNTGIQCYVQMHPVTKSPASPFTRKPIWPSGSRNLFMADAPLYWP